MSPDLGLPEVARRTSNPARSADLREAGPGDPRRAAAHRAHLDNVRYPRTKQDRLGHELSDDTPLHCGQPTAGIHEELPMSVSPFPRRGFAEHGCAGPDSIGPGAAITDAADLGTVLGIWAHPDDEAFLSAGLMAAARDAASAWSA